MNRRSFFKFLGTAAAVAVVAPKLLVPAEQGYQYSYQYRNSSTLNIADIREMKRQLCSSDVKIFRGGFRGYVHPYVIADLVGGR
jgi:hypothetical protein